MPSYDYKCPAGHVTERTQSIEDPYYAEVTCFCGLSAPRVFTAPEVIFKGPGFYSTDVSGRLNRRRRANPGDDLHREHDPVAARIADGI